MIMFLKEVKIKVVKKINVGCLVTVETQKLDLAAANPAG